MTAPRILIFQLKRIGDAILTAPALGALRQALPNAHLCVVLSGASRTLGPAFRQVDEVMPYHTGQINGMVWRKIGLTKWDVVLDLTGTDRSAFLAGLSGAGMRIAFAKDAKNWLRRAAFRELCPAAARDFHTIDLHHELVRHFLRHSLPPATEMPQVPDHGHLTLPADLSLPELPEKFAVIHPGTARPEKFWPVERWAEVAASLGRQQGLPVVLTGSNDAVEQEHIAQLKDCPAAAKVKPMDLSGKLSLLQLAGVLAKAELVLGVDSAAMHLAAAFRRPQIALFGPTNPYHWRPRHEAARVLLAGCPENDSVQEFTPRMKQVSMSDLQTGRVLCAMDALFNPRE